MQDICNFRPETNRASRVYSVAAALYSQFVLHVMLFPMLNVLHFYSSTSRSICAVPNMAVFCSSLISCFLFLLLRYFLNNSEMAPL